MMSPNTESPHTQSVTKSVLFPSIEWPLAHRNLFRRYGRQLPMVKHRLSSLSDLESRQTLGVLASRSFLTLTSHCTAPRTPTLRTPNRRILAIRRHAKLTFSVCIKWHRLRCSRGCY